jgi:endonuclease/exonuclease/phosphatase family metal-dependent hydrolase
MEIVFLNTLNGEIHEPIKSFLTEQASTTGVFCLQEADTKETNMQGICREVIPLYKGFFGDKALNDGDHFAQATYLHPTLTVLEHKVLFAAEENTGLAILTVIETAVGPVTICNFHGKAKPGDKKDTAERLRQSYGLINALEGTPPRRILGGDFNADIDTESINMFEDAGYRNLIKEYKIRTTRNRIVWDKYPQTPQLHCDYVFVSQGITVTDFKVPENEISDHLPMILSIQ